MMEALMMEARVLDIQPHPDQAMHNPGCWAVQFSVTHASVTRTFWRWHTKRCVNKNGAYVTPDNDPPTADEILTHFWLDTFSDLHGFDFKTGLFDNVKASQAAKEDL